MGELRQDEAILTKAASAGDAPATAEVLVDFVALDPASGAWMLVLVEGLWEGDVESALHRLQDRLYGCVDAILDGQLAAQLPESAGGDIKIRIDCYDMPAGEVDSFVDDFAADLRTHAEYGPAIDQSTFVRALNFVVCHDTLEISEPSES